MYDGGTTHTPKASANPWKVASPLGLNFSGLASTLALNFAMYRNMPSLSLMAQIMFTTVMG